MFHLSCTLSLTGPINREYEVALLREFQTGYTRDLICRRKIESSVDAKRLQCHVCICDESLWKANVAGRFQARPAVFCTCASSAVLPFCTFLSMLLILIQCHSTRTSEGLMSLCTNPISCSLSLCPFRRALTSRDDCSSCERSQSAGANQKFPTTGCCFCLLDWSVIITLHFKSVCQAP